MPAITDYDVAVIGAWIAGTSVAAELSRHRRVALIEQEATPGYHATSRSAAIYAPIYGPASIRALTRASRGFFLSPPAGFCTHPLLRPIGAVFVARPDQVDRLEQMRAELADADSISPVDAAALQRMAPILRAGYAVAGLHDAGSSEIDVAALHQGYLRLFKANGGTLITRAGVNGLRRVGDAWHLITSQGEVKARRIVNAAGAWADQVGALAGAEPIGLVPKRRTALLIDVPPGLESSGLPMVIDTDEAFYLKPDAGRLLISPANEDPESPCDVQPDEMDVALCIDRIERAFDLQVRRIHAKWAGLRSFVADKNPVVGFSRRVPDFYWLAGQGGYGIQTAPGLSRFAAAEIMEAPIPSDILAEGLNPSSIRPDRAGLHP